MSRIELSLRRPDPLVQIRLRFRRSAICDVVTSERSFAYDPTSTADAGGSPDPPLFAHHDSPLSALGRRVCSTLPQATRPTRPRADSPVPVVPDQGQGGIAV